MTKAELADMKKREKSLSEKYKLVSAGSIKKHKEAFVWLKEEYEEESFELDGKTVNKNEYTSFVVDGKSMRKFGIESGDIVLVKEDNNPAITETSIFVINVFPRKRNKIEYKLRKPIDFYDYQDDSEEKFKSWIEKHPRLDAEKLKYADIGEKIDECKRLGCRLLVSETTRNRKVHYSYHPENRIFGMVEHVIQNENVKIIEKR
jgi:hypothetical protein